MADFVRRSDCMTPRILTALPVYNEERHLRDVLAEVKKFSQDILVVDDGSSDRTPELMAQERKVFLLRHEQNQVRVLAMGLASDSLSSAIRTEAGSGHELASKFDGRRRSGRLNARP